MEIKALYKYERGDGGTTVSPDKPEGEYIEMVRLIADDGKILIKEGCTQTYCIDTDGAEGWNEVEDTRQEEIYDLKIDLEDGFVTEDEEIELASIKDDEIIVLTEVNE